MWIRNFIFAECGCNKEGSTNDTCNQADGECSCRPGWAGNKCQSKLKLIICIQYKTMKCLVYELENMMFSFCNVELHL